MLRVVCNAYSNGAASTLVLTKVYGIHLLKISAYIRMILILGVDPATLQPPSVLNIFTVRRNISVNDPIM